MKNEKENNNELKRTRNEECRWHTNKSKIKNDSTIIIKLIWKWK